MYHSSASISTIYRYLHEHGYRNVLPTSTNMLTSDNKKRCVQWTKQHKTDDFKSTIFTDEASFQRFRNTVRRWKKHPYTQYKRIPKNRQKVHVWGTKSVKSVLTCHTFRCKLSNSYYVHMLENYLLSAARQQFRHSWHLQQDNDSKHTSNICKQFISENVPQLLRRPSI